MRGGPRVSLDGTWEFKCNPGARADAIPEGEWRSAVVPMPWQAQFDELRHSGGVAWYRRRFTVEPESMRQAAGSAAILHFGAVDYHAAVWVNGGMAGRHEGGYLPFEFDVITFLREGDNELLVQVVDVADDGRNDSGFPFSQVPHGKQSWYGPIGGLWQSVWLEFRPQLHLAGLRLTPSPAESALGVQVILSGTPQE